MNQIHAADEPYRGMAPEHVACFIAGRALGYATAYLDGFDNAATLAKHADALIAEALIAPDETDAISDPTRLLIIAMMRAAYTTGARADRWRSVMAALVRLVHGEVVAFNAGLAR